MMMILMGMDEFNPPFNWLRDTSKELDQINRSRFIRIFWQFDWSPTILSYIEYLHREKKNEMLGIGFYLQLAQTHNMPHSTSYADNKSMQIHYRKSFAHK